MKRVGFEPIIPLNTFNSIQAFQACALNLAGISPFNDNIIYIMRKYLSKLFENKFKFLFKTLASSNNSKFNIEFINLRIKENTHLGKKNENLVVPLDEIIAPRIFKNANWDYFICEFIKKNINNEENHFFDIGANIGLITRQLQNLNINIKNYYCFEPEVNSFNILKENIKNKSTYFFNYGLSSKNSTEQLFVNPLNKSDHSIFLKNYNNNEGKIINIDLRDSNEVLKKIIYENKIQNIIYKSDTQGLDEEILLNLNDEIFSKINLLIIEISNFDYISKNIDLFFDKMQKFNLLFNENGAIIKLNDLKIIIDKKKEFNLMAKK